MFMLTLSANLWIHMLVGGARHDVIHPGLQMGHHLSFKGTC